MIEIKYMCSNGKEYNLVGNRMRPTSGYFHEYEWKPMTTDQEIGADVYGFEKEPKTYQITLTFRGPLEERKAKMDELTNCFEYDVVNLTPGRIWFGKAIFTAVFAFISALLGVLAVPVILLVTCNLIDYATGLMASKYRSQDINSYKSIRGIFKKVSMWLLVVVGAIIDELLLYAATTIGKPMPVTFLIACVVAMWLICNEIISILENIQDMGVNIPAFLQPLVKHIRSQVEEQINIDKKEDKNSEDE